MNTEDLRYNSISIHAPLRERLACSPFERYRQEISIHAPSRERQEVKRSIFIAADISIHAPSRERHDMLAKNPMRTLFQSTLPHGSDGAKAGATKEELAFQSTLPHGSDFT